MYGKGYAYYVIHSMPADQSIMQRKARSDDSERALVVFDYFARTLRFAFSLYSSSVASLALATGMVLSLGKQ